MNVAPVRELQLAKIALSWCILKDKTKYFTLLKHSNLARFPPKYKYGLREHHLGMLLLCILRLG
jgi:hypothetical protein